jgi:hypothetical protein
MLEEMATVGDERIVSWQPHGKAFRVHLPQVFARTVMTRYFKQQTKYKSFLRQLHIYGFHRIGKGIDRGAYFHSMFIRNKKSMSLRMTRKSKKSGTSSETTNAVVDNNAEPQYQDRGSLMNALLVVQSDPPILQASCTTNKERGCVSKRGPRTTAVTTTGSSDHHPDEEENPLILSSAFLFNQEVTGGLSPSHQQPIGSSEISLFDSLVDIFWMDEEEQKSAYYHGYDSSMSWSAKGHCLSTLLRGGGQQKHGDEGFFAGKKFFDVVAPKTPLMENSICQ